jgi:PAS domain S-box-containing protein
MPSPPPPTTGLIARLRSFRCLLRPVFGIYLTVMVAFIALGVAVLYHSKARETQDALTNADNLARVFAERLDGTLRRIDGDLKVFTRFLPADGLEQAAAPRYRQLYEQQFRVILDNFPEVASRTVVDARGQVIYRAGTPSPTSDYSDREWFTTLRDNPQLPMVISDVVTARSSGKPTVVISRAVRDREGRFLGAANATLDLERLTTLAASLNIGTNGLVNVRRSDNNKIVLRHPPLPGLTNTPTSGRNLEKIRAGIKSEQTVSTSVTDGIERAIAFRVLDDFPLYVTVGLASADYLAEWRRGAWYSASFALALIVAMSAFVISRVRNEARLSALARQLQAGKRDVRASEQFLRDVINSTSDGILVEDSAGAVRAINRSFRSMWQIGDALQAQPARAALAAQMASQLINPATLPLDAALPAGEEFVRLRAIELADGRRIETGASLLRQNGVITGRVWSFHDVTESKQRLRLYRSIIDSSADAFVAFNGALRITGWSAHAEAIFGMPEAAALGQPLDAIIPLAADAGGPLGHALTALQTGSRARVRQVHRIGARRQDGSEFPAEIQISGFSMGETWQYTSFVRDISSRVLEEEQVAQAQKFEAIGQLTGGLAHDFNNLLGIIIGSLDLIGENFSGDRELLEAAASAAQRGADVTKSLLAVARKQRLSPQEVEIDALLQELAPLLRHTAGKGIEVGVLTESGGAIVNIDPGGLNNALLNLVINARDAMPQGGRITISAAPVASPGETDLPGNARHVAIRVEDNGCGMKPEVISRAFDPFFTTKPRGKGTGLGLAMVYGFARQSGGLVTLSSVVDRGTLVEMRLPARATAKRLVAVPRAPAAILPLARGERVLLVDDEAGLLRVTRLWLENLGYAVTAETDAARAMQRLQGEAFAALVSDVVMPGGPDGVALADAASATQPDIAILLVSGYADGRLGRGIEKYRLLDKPFTKQQLQEALDGVLEQARAGTPQPRRAA